jgi:hypothetical protein
MQNPGRRQTGVDRSERRAATPAVSQGSGRLQYAFSKSIRSSDFSDPPSAVKLSPYIQVATASATGPNSQLIEDVITQRV